MHDFCREVQMHNADVLLFAEIDEFLALLCSEAEVFRAISAPGGIAFSSEQSHIYQRIHFFAYLACSPGVCHLLRDEFCLCGPEAVAGLYLLLWLILALIGNAKQQVVQGRRPACVLTERHELRADNSNESANLAHATPAISASAAMMQRPMYSARAGTTALPNPLSIFVRFGTRSVTTRRGSHSCCSCLGPAGHRCRTNPVETPSNNSPRQDSTAHAPRRVSTRRGCCPCSALQGEASHSSRRWLLAWATSVLQS